MSLRFLKASRALWQRRVEYRQRRLEQARQAHDPARIEKWKKLVAQALERVRHRESQIRRLSRARHVSPAGVELVAEFEGFVDHVYRDAVGVETIGFGETDRRIIAEFQGKRMSRAYALGLLKRRLDGEYASAVRNLKVPLSQQQFDALASFVYNLGPGVLGQGHTIGDALRDRDYLGAADALLLYDKAGGRTLPGLTRRRHAERDLFLKGTH